MAYTITGEKCGTVRLDAEKTGVVVTESVQRSSKVTSNPVEKGSDINDHVINDPVVFSITGVFLDEDRIMNLSKHFCKALDSTGKLAIMVLALRNKEC